jgi:uncharacterized protein YecT (DUF1311 family)
VIAVSGASLVGGAASNPSGAATLKPPVITESFTPLPCEHQTMIGLDGCAEGQLLATDRRINEQVKLLFGAIRSEDQRRNFVAVENEWLTYRKADCSVASAVFQGGTIAPLTYALCEVRDDEARSADLHSYFTDLEEGSSSAPKWP